MKSSVDEFDVVSCTGEHSHPVEHLDPHEKATKCGKSSS